MHIRIKCACVVNTCTYEIICCEMHKDYYEEMIYQTLTEESVLGVSLFNKVEICRCKDLSHFDKDQIVIAR